MTDTSKKNAMQPEDFAENEVQEAMRPPAHSTIYDGFRLMRTLGQGFLGVVYAAQNLDAAQVSALRVVTPDLVAQPQVMVQFRRLFEQWRRLAHQNILPVGELVEREHRAHYTMTLAQSGSARHYLQQHAREGQFVDLLIAVDLARQAAGALAYAHDNNLMHGDVKPENLLLQPARAILGRQAYRVQLSDFGVGELQAFTYGTHDRLIVTTPAYMSPEQCRGLRTEVRSDIYALGVVLYELLTNLVPFETRDLADAIEKHQHVAPIPPGQIRVDIPQDLEEIVLTCLAKAPDYRYRDAHELENALQGVLSRLMPQGPNPTVVLPDIPEPPIPPIEPLRDRTTFPRLQICAADGRLLRVEPLKEGTTTLGRAPGNTVVVEHAGVSRHHLNIELSEAGQILVSDLDTVNGTSLNGVPLEPRARTAWPGGGVLRVEPFWIRLQPPQRVVQQSRIGVLVEDNDITLKPGEARLLKVQLANTGRTVDHFRLEVEGVPQEWVQNLFHEVQLNPGMTAETTLRVLVPRQSQYHAGEYPMQVVARSRENPQEFGYVPMTWTVAPYLDTAVEVTPKRRSAWRRTHYTFRLRNDSNVPIVYNPTVKDDEGGVFLMSPWSQMQIPASGNLQNLVPWRTILYNYTMRLREGIGKIKIAPFEKDIALEPGQSYEHRMDVRLPIRWIGSPRPRHLHVVAENDRGASAPANVNLLHLPILPLWALPIVAILMIAFIWWLLLAPTIVTASVTPQNPPVGKPFTLNFETRNTTSVLVKPWNKRVGGGVKKLIIPEGITQPTDVQVIAYGRVKTAQTLLTITPQLPAPVIKNFSLDPQNITAGQTATLRWNVANVKNVTIDPLGTQPAKGELTQKITQDTTFTLRADSGGQTVQKSASVKLLAPGIDLFEVTPAQAAPGQTVTIRWRVRNATGVTLQPIGSVPPEGETQQKVTAGTTYTLSANVEGGQPVTQTASVTLLAPQVESFTVSPENAKVGDPITLSWSVKNASSVTIDPIGTVPAQGTRQLTAQQGVTYKLSASNGQGAPVQASAAPTVTAVPPKVTGFKVNPRKPRTGESVTISWQTQDAGSVTLDGLSGSQVVPQSGSITVTAPAQNTNLTLTAKNAEGAQDAQSVTLLVLPPAPKAEVPTPVQPAQGTLPSPTPSAALPSPAPTPPAPTPPAPAPRVVGFNASPSQVPSGGRTTLRWQVQGAEQVKIFPGGQLLPAQGSLSVPVKQNTLFTLQVVGAPSVKANVRVSSAPPKVAVQPAPTPPPPVPAPRIVGFNASPAQVSPGQRVVLRWNVKGAQQVKIFPGGKVYPAQGLMGVEIKQDTIFTLQVVGAANLKANARVDYLTPGASALPPALPPKVAQAQPTPAPTPAPEPAPAATPVPPVIGSFASSATSVARGDSVTLSWDVSGASRVSLSGVGSVPVKGSLSRPVRRATDFVLTAIGGGARVQQTVRVDVAGTSTAASIGGEKLEGVWLHPFGRMKLSVQGDEVTGSFQNDRTGDTGRLRGRLSHTGGSDGTFNLSANVTVPNNPGENISFVVAFNDALNGFYGPYNTRGARERWCGWREGAPQPPQCQ